MQGQVRLDVDKSGSWRAGGLEAWAGEATKSIAPCHKLPPTNAGALIWMTHLGELSP